MLEKMMKARRQHLAGSLTLALATSFALGGCATVSAPAKLQTLRVSAMTDKGAPVEAANCTLRNGSGEWTVTAPGPVQVVVDSQPLKLRCESADKQWAGEAIAEVRSSRAGNMLVGAGVGALVGAVAGEQQRKHDNKQGNLLAGLSIISGVLWGSLIGTGAGALATPDVSYGEAVRVSLTPVPKSDR
jgi:hypothetical protein